MQPLSFWGELGPLSPGLPRTPSDGGWSCPRGGRSRWWLPKAYGLWGFHWAQTGLSHAPGVLGLARAWDTPTHSRHGVSAPAPLRAGPGHRFRGSLSGWVGVPGPCQREPPLESLAPLPRVSVTLRPVTSDPGPSSPATADFPSQVRVAASAVRSAYA